MEMVADITDSGYTKLESPAEFSLRVTNPLTLHYKVKPYNVVDLSTRQILTDEEICKCLKEAATKELLRKQNDYYRYQDYHSKLNGDAPNFINLPPKQKSRSADSLHAYNQFVSAENVGYDDLPYDRGRANTAPASCMKLKSESECETALLRASRLVSPSSPGTAKRKVQQKLQRDGKNQIAAPRMSGTKGSPSPLVKHYSGSRIPGTKMGLSSGSLSIEKSKQSDQKGSKIATKISESKPNTSDPKTTPKLNRIAQSNYRSNISRLSNKNSDAGSECSSDSGSCRSTPVYGSRSPLTTLKKSVSPPIFNNSVITQMKPNTGVPTKYKTLSTYDKNRSVDNLTMRREHTFDNAKQRKGSSPPILMAPRIKSVDDIIKPEESTSMLDKSSHRTTSSSSIPMSRSKHSSENLLARQEENNENHKQRYESSSSRYESSSSIGSLSRRSSIESTASDSSDICRQLAKPKQIPSYSKPSYLEQKKNIESPKSRLSGIPSTSKKSIGESLPTSTKSKMRQPSSGIRPVMKATGLKKPTAAIGKSENASSCELSSTGSVITSTAETESPSVRLSARENIQVSYNSSLRPPGSLNAVDKKKKFESPLTHRRKLNYSNADKTEQNEQKNVSINHNEHSKLRQPTTNNLSPASLRKTANPSAYPLGSKQYSKLQAPPRYSQCIEAKSVQNSSSDAHIKNNSEETNLKSHDTVNSGEETFQETGINTKEITIAKIDNGLNESIEEIDVGRNFDDEKISKQLDERHTYIYDQDLRDIDSMNSSRSSEFDDGYSSLHKLDNLSPTLEDNSCKNNSDMDQNITNRNKNIQNNNGLNKLSIFIDQGKTVPIDGIEERQFKDELRNPEAHYGYAVPEDSIKQHPIEFESDYKVPVDCKTNYENDEFERPRISGLPVHPHLSKYSCDENVASSIQVAPDPFSKAFENPVNIEKKSPGSSPFKRIHHKVIVPPPSLDSICSDGGLAPVPSEYTRTPSSDGDEIQIADYLSGDLFRRAREQAKKAWSKNSFPQEFEGITGSPVEGKGRERISSDIFYSSKDIEKKSMDISPKYATRTSVGRSFDNPHTVNNEGMFRFESTSSEQEKKKKSKIKKFFKKLSTKKEGKMDYDSQMVNDAHDGYSNVSIHSPGQLQNRRSSEGIESVHSIQGMHGVNSPPISKRRMFTFNLSFKKKGRRQRSGTDCHSIISPDDSINSSTDVLSNTVRALCSPEMNRRNEYILLQHGRRGSDPSLYHLHRPPIPSTKIVRVPDPHKLRSFSDTQQQGKRSISYSASSVDDDADYINYPFSKFNLKPPVKPQRHIKGICRDRCSIHGNNVFDTNTCQETRSNYTDIATSPTGIINEKHRTISHSSDSSMVSVESSYMPQKCQYDNAGSRSSGLLRRTPLRHSVDNYNKLLEVHKQTIDKIAYEIASLRCDCETLHEFEWEDFERAEEMMQLGVNSYMVVPVKCGHKSSDKRRFYAWLRLSQQQTQQSDYPLFDITKSTLHRNCLHACHIMEQNYSAPFQDGIPKAIQIDCVYLSAQCPKMTLSKYISLTLEKHARYPEIYEREAATMLLQVVKGIQNLHANDAHISSIEAENIFVINNGEPSVVLSPRRVPNRCPALAVSILPGLGDCFQKNEEDAITSICHQLAFLLYELMHSPYQDELSDAVDMSMLLTTLPDLTIKSIYSRYLQYVINLLLGTSSHTSKSLEDLQIILEIILFGPSDISDHSEDETIVLINKWHNRRCVDMVTHILKEAPLIMLCASGPSAQDIDKIKNVDQEILLECEFLSYVSSSDIYRVSKMLNR